MANYMGLQAVFNTLANGGAQAVNIYAQEKDRQRRLAFDEKKFDANEVYRQKALEQNSRQLDQADARIALGRDKQKLLEQSYSDEQEAIRRKELIQNQTQLSGNVGAWATQKGYTDIPSYLRSDDPDAHTFLEQGVSNVASYMRGTQTQTWLKPAGKNEQGIPLFITSFTGKDGGEKSFGIPSTKEQLAGMVNKLNISFAIPDYLAQQGIGVTNSPSGQKLLVNVGGGGPELKPEQQKAVSELEQQTKQTIGVGVQEMLDNPPEQQVQQALDQVDGENEKGAAYDGMPAGLRYTKPNNAFEQRVEDEKARRITRQQEQQSAIKRRQKAWDEKVNNKPLPSFLSHDDKGLSTRINFAATGESKEDKIKRTVEPAPRTGEGSSQQPLKRQNSTQPEPETLAVSERIAVQIVDPKNQQQTQGCPLCQPAYGCRWQRSLDAATEPEDVSTSSAWRP